MIAPKKYKHAAHLHLNHHHAENTERRAESSLFSTICLSPVSIIFIFCGCLMAASAVH
jgi:hypothetical protein